MAGFPEGHPNSGNSISESPSPQKGKRSIKEETLTEEEKNTAREELDAQLDIEVGMLKEKVAAGADFVLTQFFYDPEVFLSFQTRCRSAGISCPIIPGIMPIQGYVNLCSVVVIFPIDCCITKHWPSFITPYNNTSIACKHHTNNNN